MITKKRTLNVICEYNGKINHFVLDTIAKIVEQRLYTLNFYSIRLYYRELSTYNIINVQEVVYGYLKFFFEK